MPKVVLLKNPSTDFSHLVAAIRKEIAAGRREVEHRQALTYWRVGKFIKGHILYHKDRAGYGEKIFVRLAKKLEIDQSTLYQSVKFFETYPILDARPKLHWSDYRKLITVKDQHKRRSLEEKTRRQGLVSRQLENEVRALKAGDGENTAPATADSIKLLLLTRGQLYTYRLDGKEEEILLDLGFNVFWENLPAAVLKMKAGTVLASRLNAKTKSGFQFNASTVKEKEIFTYKARVLKVIDGDTLSVSVQLGFGQRVRQRLRLRFIDAPEIDTPEGKKARDFVANVFKDCAFVVIKTYQSDKYDRYLTDLFFLPGESDPATVAAQGRFLNQELLSAGLVKRYEE